MTIAAESFAGRVLAVLSRRSPGFRPPVTASGLLLAPNSPAAHPPAPVPDVPRPRETSQANPIQDGVTGRKLVDVTAHWKSVSPQERLRCRGALREVADFLKAAAEVRALAGHRASALGLELSLARGLHLGLDLGLGLGLVRALGLDDARTLDRARAIDRARGLDLDRARELARDLDRARELDRDREAAREAAHETARNLASGIISDLNVAHHGLDVWRGLDLARDIEDALDDASALELELDLDRAREAAHDLVRSLEVHRDLARSVRLALYREVTRDLDRRVDRARALDLARDLDLDRARDAARDLVHELARASDSAVALARDDFGLDIGRHYGRDVVPAPDRDLIEAHGNLTDAANNFVGADFTTVDPAGFNLVGIRWDSGTRWPTPEWTARIRRASVEDPPGSGVFIVQPEEGHMFSDRGVPVPIS